MTKQEQIDWMYNELGLYGEGYNYELEMRAPEWFWCR